MAKTLQIRDVPEDVHRVLKQRAAAAGASLSDYLRTEVMRIAERPAVSDVLRMADRRHGGARIDAIVEAVRAGRERS